MLMSSLNPCCMKIGMIHRHKAKSILVPFWCKEGGEVLSVHIKKMRFLHVNLRQLCRLQLQSVES